MQTNSRNKTLPLNTGTTTHKSWPKILDQPSLVPGAREKTEERLVHTVNFPKMWGFLAIY